ncbi:MAG: D-glycero-beta-D-manno-heptose-7-phosphate kinase [Melioribacteraceae bacterium]|nr:MAG: D-glycero-beta-D-manno-heptose-7-phosphate kinase [Melioribacteraceae bacterium]
MNFSKSRLKELSNNFSGKRIAVIGDMMLDCYFWGDVKRISPEAPVPVVEIDDEFFRFGGAANVALNISSLGGIPIPLGVVGNDNDGNIFQKLIDEKNIDSSGLIIDNSRPTTAKTRVIAGKQHIVRIDKESKQNISKESEDKILGKLRSEIKNIDAIILQDYNKGVLTPRLIEKVIDLAIKNKIIITVDPKFNNFFKYTNVTLFKPNRKETEDVFGTHMMNDEDIHNSGHKLLEKLNAKYVLLTLGEKGVALFEKGKKTVKRIPTKARKVSDVSGAGDTVIATLTIALAAGAKIDEAAYLANYAGGLVCEEVGIVPIQKNKLFNTVAEE